MSYVCKAVRFVVVILLWANIVVASEYKSFPVPRYNQHHQSSSQGFIALPLLSLGKFAGAFSYIHVPNFGKLFQNIDLSSGAKIVEEHKVILGAATTIIFLSLLVKQLQRSELCGKWLHEKYNGIETSVDSYTNDCIQSCPAPIQYALTPLKVAIKFLCDAIKRYVAMNKTTIVGSVMAPVTGKVLDSVFVCPIPLLNFTSIGGVASGVILTKGYFDSHFEKMNERFDGLEANIGEADKKNMEQHSATQGKIEEVKKEVGLLKGLLHSLDKKSEVMIRLVTAYGQKLSTIASTVVSLENTGKKNSQQLESIESQVLLLRQELGLMKQEMAKLVTENKSLRNDLGSAKKHLDGKFNILEEKIDGGFNRIENKLDNPTVVPILISTDNKSDSFTTESFIASPNELMLRHNKHSGGGANKLLLEFSS